ALSIPALKYGDFRAFFIKNQAVNWHKLEQSYDQQGQQGFTLVKQNKKDKLYGKLVLFQLKAHAKAHVGI
ncbi:hypothetical protein CP357_02150, partial [Lactobacillus sp. UMNPBX6]